MYLASINGSLTATTSISSLEVAIRKTNLPIRPKPAGFKEIGTLKENTMKNRYQMDTGRMLSFAAKLHKQQIKVHSQRRTAMMD